MGERTQRLHRLPQEYIAASNILKAVTQEKKGLNNELYAYNDKNQRRRVNLPLVKKLVVLALEHREELQAIKKFLLQNSSLPYLNEEKTFILATELLWVRGYLPKSGHSIVELLLTNQDKLLELTKNPTASQSKSRVNKPRFVRINLLKTTVKYVLKSLEDDGWMQLDSAHTYEAYLKVLEKLEEPNFIQDFHFPEVLAFPTGTKWHDSTLYQKSFILLQSKSSCIPVKLLNPQPGSIVLDMCAAPGMKTSQLAAHMNNIGEIHAVEKDPRRYQILKQILKDSGVTCVKTYNMDSLGMDFDSVPGITHILVDPSCSGSGMDRPEMQIDKTEEQIKRLSSFQLHILVKALSFPSVRRVVYSTCSQFAIENEAVVSNAINYTNHQFKIVDAWPEAEGHFTRGSSDYQGGELCFYLKPEKDFTTGFFVAVIERISRKKLRKNKTQAREQSKDSEIDLLKKHAVDETEYVTDFQEIVPKSKTNTTNSEKDYSLSKLKHKKKKINTDIHDSDSVSINQKPVNKITKKKVKGSNVEQQLMEDADTTNTLLSNSGNELVHTKKKYFITETAASDVDTKLNKKKYMVEETNVTLINDNKTDTRKKKKRVLNESASDEAFVKPNKKKCVVVESTEPNDTPSSNDATNHKKKKKRIINESASDEEFVKPLKKKCVVVESTEPNDTPSSNDATNHKKKKKRIINESASDEEFVKPLKKKCVVVESTEPSDTLSSNDETNHKKKKKKKRISEESASDEAFVKLRKKKCLMVEAQNSMTH